MHDVVIRETSSEELDLVVGVVNAATQPDGHISVQRLRGWLDMRPADARALDLLALADGRPVAAASVVHGPYDPDGRFVLHVEVVPEARRQGLGRTLYDRLRAHAATQGARELAVWVHEHDLPLVQGWLERQGFREVERMRHAELDLRDLNADVRAAADELEGNGAFDLVTLADTDSDEVRDQLFQVYLLAERDVPSSRPRSDMERALFDRQIANERLLPDCSVLARSAGQVVGFTLLGRQDEERAGTWMTGVHPEYRGRGVAFAVKARCALLARERGFHALRTNNHVTNMPMLAVNRRLGYRPMPERILYALERGR